MKNVKMEMSKDGILTIKIDTKERYGLSGSGKNTVIATTGGNAPVEGAEDIKIGINCYTKA